MATYFYPDVSHHQGVINWAAVKAAGFTHVMIKSTGGQVDGLLRYVDPMFKANWLGAHEQGFICGTYHFARNNNSGVDEWNWHWQNVQGAGGLSPGDWLCYDQEDTRTGAQTLAKKRTQEFIGAAIAAEQPLGELYSGKWYLEPAGIRAVDVPEGWRKLWISDYSGVIEVPSGWSSSDIVARQSTDKRSVPGIPELTDFNEVLIDWRSQQEDDMAQADQDAINANTNAQFAELWRKLDAMLGASSVNNGNAWTNNGVGQRFALTMKSLLGPLYDDEQDLTNILNSLGAEVVTTKQELVDAIAHVQGGDSTPANANEFADAVVTALTRRLSGTQATG